MADDFSNFDGHMTSTLIVVERDGGNWKGSITLVQGRLPIDDKWENRKVEFVSIHKNPETVTGDLILTLSSYLESCDGNLFNVEKGSKNVETNSNEIAQ